MLAGCTALTQLFDEIGITLPRVSFAYTDGHRTLSLAGRPGQTGLLWALLRAHGFSWRERLALMRALFIAAGPRIREGLRVPAFKNIHVYDFMCAVLGLTPAKNDGDTTVTRDMLR